MLPNTTRLFHQYCIFDSILDCVSTLIGSCTGPLPQGKVGGQLVAGALGWEVVGWICSVTHVASASPSHPLYGCNDDTNRNMVIASYLG
jgi:hypothetical protein